MNDDSIDINNTWLIYIYIENTMMNNESNKIY